MNQSHTQANTDTHTHANTHTQANIHTHTHTHTETKKVLDRLSRAIGHMEAVKKMVEEGRDCSEILVQIAAVRSAVNNIGKIILKDHIDHCVVDAVETGDRKVLEDLSEAIDRFVK
ncbi:metal-sensing transcriptional repressor [Lachnoclostridium sp. An118]|uniref:metal-sensing transcriptional repressor n=1 Tax=Lachnoclostridium sp. An118 TaxID=1965547 RepID=UPI000B38F1B2|nr:metal-sensing transcriptional repressor [Lachnoclostridium sp. An118]OUQ51480.1 CsoR family transcriptional regulator [Lachnoclostridium sp. An118]HJA44130.1 metal-sensing transcriptional repressor [Candidatus Dorea stercoravium]